MIGELQRIARQHGTERFPFIDVVTYSNVEASVNVLLSAKRITFPCVVKVGQVRMP